MKVLVVAHSFPRFPGDTHGPFVERLSEELAALGHEMHVLVPRDRELVTARSGPLTIHAFRYAGPDRWHLLGYSRTLRRDIGMRLGAWLESPLYFHFGRRALARLVRRERYDLVHAHWILPNGYLAAQVKAATGVPFCATLHGSDVFIAERNAVFSRLARRALRDAAHVTSCSADLRDRLLALDPGADPARVHLVPNGTDLGPTPDAAARAAARRRWGLADEDAVVVAVGRLVDKKGFRYLLEAMPALAGRVPAAKLVLGGGGDLEGDLRRLAARLGIADRVVFTGNLSHPEVLALIAAGDVFAMPSVRDPRGNVDGLPIVVLEAMAAARPVVASRIAGIPLAVAEGETGLLVPERDPAALADALGGLLAAPEEARRLGERGRQRVAAELNWGAIARLHDRLYRAAVAA